ncbi:MAG: mannose-6-phosphate isomerase, class I, partial [Chitinophagaceae bacterium]
MPELISLYEIQGVVQPYSWGGPNYISELLGVPNPAGQPQAEYWLGAHPNAPARVIQMQKEQASPLDQLIALHPREFLGESVYRQYGRLPYLLKILDVKDMLSIQAHPSKSAAEKGFQEEEKRGIPLQAADRNYKDDNHKPELMFALSEFWLLQGFKAPALLESTLQQVTELQFLLPVWKKGGYTSLYETVMLLPQAEVQRVLTPLFDRLLPAYEAGKLKKESPDFWAARACQTFCKSGSLDRGIFSIYLLNLVQLKPGQAVYQDVGVLHAYLEGQNVELMANSDNV